MADRWNLKGLSQIIKHWLSKALSWQFALFVAFLVLLSIAGRRAYQASQQEDLRIPSLSDLSPFWYYTSIIVVALVVLAVMILALWLIPEWQIKRLQKKTVLIKQGDLFSLKNEARRTVAQVLGGFLVIVGLLLTSAQLAVTSRMSQETNRLAQEGQITERFSKAVEQLGNREKVEVRLGGIYALERIAKDSEKDYLTIMEVLTAYVRENAPRRKLTNEILSKDPPLGTDIQAILTVIGRREKRRDLNGLDLSRTNLRKAFMNKAALNRANLFEADLSGAYLSGADLEGAFLLKANLFEATLSTASLEVANLEGANLSGANLFLASLRGANLRAAYLNGAKLFSSDLTNTDLRGANLLATDLYGVKLGKADLSEAILHAADLRGTDLSEVKNLLFDQIKDSMIDYGTKLPIEIEDKYKKELKAKRTMQIRGGKGGGGTTLPPRP